jgi:hypothetical protein
MQRVRRRRAENPELKFLRRQVVPSLRVEVTDLVNRFAEDEAPTNETPDILTLQRRTVEISMTCTPPSQKKLCKTL